MFHLLLKYDCQGFGLCPLGEIINCNDGKLDLTLHHREWPDYINAPLGKWPKAEEWDLLFHRAVDHAGILLAIFLLLRGGMVTSQEFCTRKVVVSHKWRQTDDA